MKVKTSNIITTISLIAIIGLCSSFSIGNLKPFLKQQDDLKGSILYSQLANDIAITDIELNLDETVWDNFSKDQDTKSAVFIAVDKSGSMNTLIGMQKRMDIARTAVLTQAKKFFEKTAAGKQQIPLFITLFDDQVVTEGFTQYTKLETFFNDNSQPGGDTGFYLAFQDILAKIKENVFTNVYVYLISDGQDSYPQDTVEAVEAMKVYLNENCVHSRFSTIGIAQPDTQLMGYIINYGTLSGTYVFVDEDIESDAQIKQINQFFSLVNIEIFNHPAGITLSLLDETIHIPLLKNIDMPKRNVFILYGHIFNLKNMKDNLKRLNETLQYSIDQHENQNIKLRRKEVKKEEHVDLLTTYNDIIKIDFDLTREIIKETIDTIQAYVNGILKYVKSSDILKDYQYVDSQLTNIEMVVVKKQDKLLDVKERGQAEQFRNHIMQRYEAKTLQVFTQDDFYNDSEFDDNSHPDPTPNPQNSERVMKTIIGIKHIFELLISIILFFFYACNCKCRFLRFKYCQIYVFVIYIILLLQDFILLAPPIWIFVYHVALLMTIFVVSLRRKDKPNPNDLPRSRNGSRSNSRGSSNSNEEQREALNPNQFVNGGAGTNTNINHDNIEEVDITNTSVNSDQEENNRQRIVNHVNEDDDDNDKVFSRFYRKEFLKQSSLKKIAFFGFLIMEYTLSTAVIVMALRDL
eukprot:403368705